VVVARTVEQLEDYHALDYMANVAGFKAVQNLEAWDGKAVVRCLGFRGNASWGNPTFWASRFRVQYLRLSEGRTYGMGLYHLAPETESSEEGKVAVK
jgi:hypothetical protein